MFLSRQGGCEARLRMATAAGVVVLSLAGLTGCGVGKLSTEDTCKKMGALKSPTAQEAQDLAEKTGDAEIREVLQAYARTNGFTATGSLTEQEQDDMVKKVAAVAKKCEPYGT